MVRVHPAKNNGILQSLLTKCPVLLLILLMVCKMLRSNRHGRNTQVQVNSSVIYLSLVDNNQLNQVVRRLPTIFKRASPSIPTLSDVD